MPTDDQTPSGSQSETAKVAYFMQPLSLDMVNGRLIKAARSLIGWDQRELAEKAGVAVRSISAFEDGSREPIRRVRAAIGCALGDAGIVFVQEGAIIGILLKGDTRGI